MAETTTPEALLMDALKAPTREVPPAQGKPSRAHGAGSRRHGAPRTPKVPDCRACGKSIELTPEERENRVRTQAERARRASRMRARLGFVGRDAPLRK